METTPDPFFTPLTGTAAGGTKGAGHSRSGEGRSGAMASCDRVLVGPPRAELERVLREAVTAANRKGHQRLLPWPPDGHEGLLAEAEAAAEGWHQWNGGEGQVRSGESRSIVVLAWWTDLMGRKHYRVVGRRGRFGRP